MPYEKTLRRRCISPDGKTLTDERNPVSMKEPLKLATERQ
jgi:hypothetical protein